MSFPEKILFLLFFVGTRWSFTAPQRCPGEPTILSQDSLAGADNKGADKALSPSCGSGGNWIAADNVENAGFTLDYGAVWQADGFYLRNDPNTKYRDR